MLQDIYEAAFKDELDKVATSLQKRISSGANVVQMKKKVKTKMSGKVKKPILAPTEV